MRYSNQARLLLLPYILGLLVLVAVPALFSFGLAFFHYDGLTPPRWAGTLNFRLSYTESIFPITIRNSLALIVLPVPLRVLGAFLLAWWLQGNGRFLGWVRAAVYLPSVIPTAAYALAWLWIFNPLYGPLNLLLLALGLPAPAWLVDPIWAKPALMLMSLWQIGEGFLVSLAALQDIPPELDDAAHIDGANPAQTLWYVTLPLIAPILLLLALRDAMLIFQESFANIYLLTGGGPYYATFTLPFFIYEQGFDLLSFGVASATLWIMYGLTGGVVILLYLIARQWNIGATDETFVL